MIITTKHRFMLWVPTLLYVWLVLGDFGRSPAGDVIYRISQGGALSSVLILTAAVCLSRGGNVLFITGIVLWILALAALLLGDTTLLVLHF